MPALLSPAVNLVMPVNWVRPINTGLIAWWLVVPGNDRGGVWRDITKRGTDAIIKNVQPWRGAERPGSLGSLDLAGIDEEYLDGLNAHAGSLDVVDFTLTAWVKPRALASFQRVLCAGNNGGATRNRYSLLFNGSFLAYQINDTGHADTSTGSVADNVWTHVAAVHRSAPNTITFYLDGVADPAAVTTAGADPGTGLFTCVLGVVDNTNNDTQFFNGQLDDVRIFNRALPAADMKALYLDSLKGYHDTLNRIDRSPILGVEPPAGSLSIPAAMASYRRRHEMRV